MPQTRRVTVDLPEPLLADVESRVARGEFENASEVISHLLFQDAVEREEEAFDQELMRGLRALPAGATDDDAVGLKRAICDRRHAELQAMLQVGLDEADRGKTTEFDRDQFLAEARRRFAAGIELREALDAGLHDLDQGHAVSYSTVDELLADVSRRGRLRLSEEPSTPSDDIGCE